MLIRRRRDDRRPVNRLGADTAPDHVPLLGIDHLELYVGNPGHTARLFAACGFRVIASQGRHSGVQDVVSYVLRQGDVTLLLTGGTTPRQDAVVHVAARGDSVKDIAWRVPDADQAYGTAIRNDVEPVHLPVGYNDDDGDLTLCPISSPAGILHTVVQRDAYHGTFCPGFVEEHDAPVPVEPGRELLSSVLGFTIVVRPRTLAAVSRHYERLYGFEVAEEHQLDAGAATDTATFRVLRRPDLPMAVTLVEPGQRRRRTHLDEFLRLHGGPGVHAIGLRTADLVGAVDHLRRHGLPVLPLDDREAATPSELTARGIVEEECDGRTLRSAVIGPLQHRTPLFLELHEVEGQTADVPLVAWRAQYRVLADRVAEETSRDVLSTWQAGR